ncbi:ATP-grasp domain-containing protein [Limnospira fusiformis KN01]|uniref:ATP-grasp domain-containing protein n=1 Tax=Limnospira TaxID=2596745 RepID=UPI001CA73931|nr:MULTISPECIES: ATP-grasp domain-containing protein [Limnospira]MDT9198039.1 ATP-grasp domain-containing protein [Limnospira sp. PMC 1042.18]ULB45186.1 ATP-grasp domain-containing protein [Limnospira fusiformis KN01]
MAKYLVIIMSKLRILTESSGSLTSAYFIRAIREAGYECVASDVDESSVGRYLADDFIKMPYKNSNLLWKIIEKNLIKANINVVIPSFDETLVGWSERKEYFSSLGVHVIVSDSNSISICQDKWLTYNFFKDNGIPTARTSLQQDFHLIKPRQGRGAKGIKITNNLTDMEGMISQEFLEGTEYSVDVFCDTETAPIYIVPRRRIKILDGKSTSGVVEEVKEIEEWVKIICSKIRLIGFINLQCFIQPDKSIKFIEINPRLAGGMALGFAATENWIFLAVNNLIEGHPIVPKPIRYGMEMKRYYAEVFIPPN